MFLEYFTSKTKLVFKIISLNMFSMIFSESYSFTSSMKIFGPKKEHCTWGDKQGCQRDEHSWPPSGYTSQKLYSAQYCTYTEKSVQIPRQKIWEGFLKFDVFEISIPSSPEDCLPLSLMLLISHNTKASWKAHWGHKSRNSTVTKIS